MTTQQMRLEVARAYRGEAWQRKVARMTDAQVVAIFKRLQEQGKIKV